MKQQETGRIETSLEWNKRKFFIDRVIQITIAACSIIGTACLVGGVRFVAGVYQSWDSMQNRMSNMESSVNAVQVTSNNTATDVKVIKAEQANTKDEIKELKQYLLKTP